MRAILDMFKDHNDANSISRAIPALVIVWILVLTTFSTITTGTLVDIPPGWREIFLTSILAYGISKAKEALEGRLPVVQEAPDGNP